MHYIIMYVHHVHNQQKLLKKNIRKISIVENLKKNNFISRTNWY